MDMLLILGLHIQSDVEELERCALNPEGKSGIAQSTLVVDGGPERGVVESLDTPVVAHMADVKKEPEYGLKCRLTRGGWADNR